MASWTSSGTRGAAATPGGGALRAAAILALLVFANPGQADPVEPGSTAYLDWKNGFRDLRFGDPPSTLGTESQCRRDEQGHKDLCRRSGDRLRIGKARVEKIEYAFFQQQLWYVAIQSSKDCGQLKLAIDAAYGEPTRTRREADWDEYEYEGQRVHARFIDWEPPFAKDCKLTIRSLKVQRRYERDERRRAVEDL